MTSRALTRLAGAGLLTLLVASCQQATPLPGSGSIDGMDLGLEFGLDLENLTLAQPQPDPELCREAAERVDLDVREPGRMYIAETRLGEEELNLRIVVLSLPEGGRLAVAADARGNVRASALWGTPELDNDTDGAWMTFRFQFHDTGLIGITEAYSPDQVDAYWTGLTADSSAAAASTRALYRHRVLMSANSHFIRSGMRSTARGSAPSRDWIRKWKDNFRDVADLSSDLSHVIGERAGERHRRLALDAVDRLDEVAVGLETQEPREIRRLISGQLRRETCRECHTIRSAELGGDEIRGGLVDRLRELGVRPDVRRVGWDLWSVPGRERTSQSVANAFKAAIILLQETPVG